MFSLPIRSSTTSNGVFSPSFSDVADPAELRVDLLAVGLDLGADVAEGAAVAGQAEADVELVDDVERVEELAGRVGGVAVVEEERDPAEQVVAGDQQAALGLVEDDVGRRVAGRLVGAEEAEVGRHLDAVDQLAVGRRRRDRCSGLSPRRAS